MAVWEYTTGYDDFWKECIDSFVACFLSNDSLRHVAVGLDDDLLDLEGGLDGVGLVVDPFELLESAALGLDTVTQNVSNLFAITK